MECDNTKVITTVITKEQLIKFLVEESNMDNKVLKNIYNILESKIRNLLAEANLNQNISIKLFEGITLNSKFVNQRRRKDNLTGKIVTFKSKIKTKAIITRRYNEKLNQLHTIN